MTILLTGGGSGGHITPLLAVARELKHKAPSVKLHFVGEMNSRFAHLVAEDETTFQKTSYILAGKFRRYHKESWLSRLTDIGTILLNLRDFIYASVGLLQSFYLLLFHRPDMIFIKGGYVGLPLGMAARVLRVPYVTHDSDAIAGLTNRLIGKGAKFNAVGMHSKFYPYDKQKIIETGVPVDKNFVKFDSQQVTAVKKELGIREENDVLLITGGSNGARRLNEAMAKITPWLLDQQENLTVVHQVGKGNLDQYGETNHPRLIKLEFIDKLERYSGIASLIITRAGANTIAEYSCQAKACVLVPNPHLTEGHQLRNAEALDAVAAAEIISEKQLADTAKAKKIIGSLLKDDEKRVALGKNLYGALKHDSAERLADLILNKPKQKQ
jgi:UDP-N-acetylglucosamine--N-acetylmuramyl-(pentapeptide) pyrophosphoryl-undecaprenol N-acetylglucosamine transferase